MGRPWWHDSYWEKKEKRRRRFRWPSRKSWIWVALVLLSLFLSAASTSFQPDLFDWILGFVSYFCRIIALCIFIRVLLSWFRFGTYGWPIIILYDLTSPILEPLRRTMPTFGGFDFSPIVAILILYFIPFIIGRLISLFI
jgi:YggT family protein